MRRLRETLICLLLIGAGAGLGTGTLSAFAAQSTSNGNQLQAGTVDLSVDSSGQAMFSVSAAQPGSLAPKCALVTSTGTLDSQVRLFGAVSGGLADHLTVEVVRGSAASTPSGSCSSFAADTADHAGLGAGVVWRGPASQFPSTFANGIVDPSTWTTGDKHAYKFNLTLSADPAAQGRSATLDFTWEAQNL